MCRIVLTRGKVITDYSDKGPLVTTKMSTSVSSYLKIYCLSFKTIFDLNIYFLVKIRESPRSFLVFFKFVEAEKLCIVKTFISYLTR